MTLDGSVDGSIVVQITTRRTNRAESSTPNGGGRASAIKTVRPHNLFRLVMAFVAWDEDRRKSQRYSF